MKKENKKYFVIISLYFLLAFFFSKSFADDAINFLSLKNSEVNLRQGPSYEYPIKLKYYKKYLPVIIIDRSETWRKIIDYQNNSGWIHISQLSKKKSAINIKNNSILYKKSTIFSKPIAKLETGRLILVKKCKINWCKVVTGEYKGWILKKFLWGKIK